MKETKERELFFTEKVKNFAYNTRFKVLRFFEEYGKDSIFQSGDQIHILGNKFVATKDNLQELQNHIYEIFSSTPWITYRAGFPQLPDESDSYVSDTGWGCMVRVGQMLFAQLLKHHKKLVSRDEIQNLIKLFSDYDEKEPFSIHNIARMARREYGLKPGQWYNPSQIAFILGELHNKWLAKEVGLRVQVFNSGNLFFDMIAEVMLEKKVVCKCGKKNSFICEQCNVAKNGVAVIVLSRLGLNGPQKKYLRILQRLMEFPNFQGVIGGKPQKALYFLGKHKEQYIYLDPHFVHTAEKKVDQPSDTYFCESFRKCWNTSIDSSLGICFYCRDVSELNSFHKEINVVKDDNVEDFFIFVSDETPSYSKEKKNGKKIVFEIEKEENDDFQML